MTLPDQLTLARAVAVPIVVVLFAWDFPDHAYWATAVASRNLPAVTTALGLLTTPVVSVAVATLWLGEPLTWPLVAAIALVLGGIALGTTGASGGGLRRAGT